MTYRIDIQERCHDAIPFSHNQLSRWVRMTLKKHIIAAELTLCLVDEDEITELNQRYRNKSQATNVLAFESNIPAHIKRSRPFLGDVVICPKVLHEESLLEERSIQAHWAHIVIHGVLHLLNFDHLNEQDTPLMQAEEIELLANLGFQNPYDDKDKDIE